MEVEIPIQVPDAKVDRLIVDRLQRYYTAAMEAHQISTVEGINQQWFSTDIDEEIKSLELAIEAFNLAHSFIMMINAEYYKGNSQATNFQAKYEAQGRTLRAIAEKYPEIIKECSPLPNEAIPNKDDE